MKKFYHWCCSPWGKLVFVLAWALLIFSACATTQTEIAKMAADKAKEDEAFAIGVDAYIYGYPLVTMEMTRRVHDGG